MKRTLATAAALGLAWTSLAGIASATMPMQKQAKDAGVAGVACITCHAEKMPKKGAMTLNERGKWLVEQKKEKKADKADGAWLKGYVEKGEAKK
jgi:hypothetical protein